jgi:putative transcriptional regulator
MLLAMPGMPDPRFDRAVVALCVHDSDGALGIGLDTELEGLTLHGLLEDLEIPAGVAPDCPVLYGGPVEPGRGFVVHSAEWEGEGTLRVGEEEAPLWALTGSRDVLRAIAEGHGPNRWVVALGYAGWGAGQLDGEMRRHGWYAADGHFDIAIAATPEARWTSLWHAEGIDPALLAPETGRA